MLATARYRIYSPVTPYDVWEKRYGVTTEAMIAYRESLTEHIRLVNLYGNKFGADIIDLELHDKSKWTKREFPFYANRFHGNKIHNREFISALNHHYANNMHHPEYWIQGTGYAPMPRKYVLEMIADWHAASFQYTGSDNIQGWLDTKLDTRKFHPASLDLLRRELREIGYDLRTQEVS